ncbi:MAG TPA: DUF4157 domain-containing protein [Puia sp.]
MSYQLRNYRHRNPKGGDEKKSSSPFFKSPQKGAVQKKKRDGFFPGIQRLATSKEDEKLATNDAKMEKDKEEPMKPVQRSAKPGEKKKKEKEKPVQKRQLTVQRKARKTSDAVADAIKKQAGKGSSLPPTVLTEMNHAFGMDFCHVRVHYDAASAALCKELNAAAFTHGQDIYFGEGMYNPHSEEGKKLLAHELTHVVQQANPTYYDHT